MQKEEIQLLVKNYLNGVATAEELERLSDWYGSASDENVEWFAEVEREEELLKVSMYANIERKIGKQEIGKQGIGERGIGEREHSGSILKLWLRIAVAAAVAMIVFGVWLFNSRYGDGNVKPQTAAYANDLAPGKQGATLTLGNGKRIALSEAKNGVVVGKDLEYNDGTKVAGEELGSAMVEVTAETARGQTYSFTLPDGSKVWLNADSKISFPSQFKEGQRRIMLEGEAYFEVVKDQVHPFVVGTSLSGKRGGQEVEVLGTHFNINSYTNEPDIKTTLLEGSIKISSGSQNRIIKPNEQAIAGRGSIEIREVTAEDAVAWKNGYFQFNGDNLESIITRIARWYDISPVWQDETLKQEVFLGTVSRYEKISKVLHMLERTGTVSFSVTADNKLIIRKKNNWTN